MNFGLLLICLAAISWGTTGATMVLLSKVTELSPLVVGFWRLAIASPFLLLLARQQGKLRGWQSRSELLTYAGLGLTMAIYQVCYFCGVSLAGVAVTALVAICSSPLFITILAVTRLGERLTKQLAIALVLGLIGTALLVANPAAFTVNGGQFLLGALLALGAGLSYAIGSIIAKVGVATLEPLQVAAISFTIAAILLSPAIVLTPSLPALTAGMPFLLYLGLVPTGIAYAIYMIGLRRTQATVAGIAVLLEPLTATLLGVVVFRESLGLLGGLGALLLLGAIGLLSIRRA
ncbi:DMT family transporter [Leptolyngbya ohadii]|uniref:DMT family transporter n=1 Tax=Leptolyngbya ohadii TaxID=1962290 RepID=UPI000B599BE2|nr:EamA family transporter [Leptolyngbya ohadii]